MEKGMILYVTEAEAAVALRTGAELAASAASLGVTAVAVARSKKEAVLGWMSLSARGIEQILFMTVAYNAALDRFECGSGPVRLHGAAARVAEQVDSLPWSAGTTKSPGRFQW
jgi:hypothetical protein